MGPQHFFFFFNGLLGWYSSSEARVASETLLCCLCMCQFKPKVTREIEVRPSPTKDHMHRIISLGLGGARDYYFKGFFEVMQVCTVGNVLKFIDKTAK